MVGLKRFGETFRMVDQDADDIFSVVASKPIVQEGFQVWVIRRYGVDIHKDMSNDMVRFVKRRSGGNDSPATIEENVPIKGLLGIGREQKDGKTRERADRRAVSYTHLTLPTICSV